ncbi:2Fe-2S ferredoxin-type domain-containing protein [Podospora fimiseda]|uniref:2Fe-2S ferredoxin-type domain-containing protein n=1 Tax=Podospora fimiseda TaxID=252190 RepID=A0AAN7H008_9PEZI|nr:2Fe-2S ferredoxin-type domain-containing protein [Podospora fimiseda]
MAAPRLLSQGVRLASKRTTASVLQQSRYYSIRPVTTTPQSGRTARFSQSSLRLGSIRSQAHPRTFTTTSKVSHGHVDTPKPGEELYVTFIDKEGAEHNIACNKGDNLLDIAQAHDLEMEGACGGSCACSTCHVIVMDQEYFDKMPEADDDENDMLDLAFGLQETSRLGCQIVMTPELDGLRVQLPSTTRNMQSSDFK